MYVEEKAERGGNNDFFNWQIERLIEIFLIQIILMLYKSRKMRRGGSFSMKRDSVFADLYKHSTSIIKIHFLCHEQFIHIGFLQWQPKYLIHFRLFFSLLLFNTWRSKTSTKIRTIPKRVAVGFLLGLELNFFQVCWVKLRYGMRWRLRTSLVRLQVNNERLYGMRWRLRTSLVWLQVNNERLYKGLRVCVSIFFLKLDLTS